MVDVLWLHAQTRSPQLTRNSKPTDMLRMDQVLTIRFGQQKTLATDVDYLY